MSKCDVDKLFFSVEPEVHGLGGEKLPTNSGGIVDELNRQINLLVARQMMNRAIVITPDGSNIPDFEKRDVVYVERDGIGNVVCVGISNFGVTDHLVRRAVDAVCRIYKASLGTEDVVLSDLPYRGGIGETDGYNSSFKRYVDNSVQLPGSLFPGAGVRLRYPPWFDGFNY